MDYNEIAERVVDDFIASGSMHMKDGLVPLIRDALRRVANEATLAGSSATPRETTYDKPEDPAMVAALAEVEKMLGRKTDDRERGAVADRVCAVKAIGEIECDGAKVPAWKVYAACLAYCRDVVKINSSVKGLAGYAMKVLETCQRNKLGPGKRHKPNTNVEIVTPKVDPSAPVGRVFE